MDLRPSTDDLASPALRWRKSSRSVDQGNCVELTDVWRKSSRSSDAGNCVELAPRAPHVAVRDSKRPAQTPQAYRQPEWSRFAAGVKSGRFDLG